MAAPQSITANRYTVSFVRRISPTSNPIAMDAAPLGDLLGPFPRLSAQRTRISVATAASAIESMSLLIDAPVAVDIGISNEIALASGAASRYWGTTVRAMA